MNASPADSGLAWINVLTGSLPNKDGMLRSGLINRCQLNVWDAASVPAMKQVFSRLPH